jgi:hypothetical protein
MLTVKESPRVEGGAGEKLSSAEEPQSNIHIAPLQHHADHSDRRAKYLGELREGLEWVELANRARPWRRQ